jgi:hypothetical protein
LCCIMGNGVFGAICTYSALGYLVSMASMSVLDIGRGARRETDLWVDGNR